MNPILIILASIIGFFVVLLTIKRITAWKFCVICASVSMTWIILLALYWFGIFNDPIVIAVLIGQSVVGVYYMLEKRVKEELLVFRLPFLLTATVLALAALGYMDIVYTPTLLLVAVWTVFLLIYVYRSNARTRTLVRRLIDCCKDW